MRRTAGTPTVARWSTAHLARVVSSCANPGSCVDHYREVLDTQRRVVRRRPPNTTSRSGLIFIPMLTVALVFAQAGECRPAPTDQVDSPQPARAPYDPDPKAWFVSALRSVAALSGSKHGLAGPVVL